MLSADNSAMLRISKIFCKSLPVKGRFLSLSVNQFKDNTPDHDYMKKENPIDRTLRLLKNDMGKVKNIVTPNFMKNKSSDKPVDLDAVDNFLESRDKNDIFQTHCDVLIIGGGGVGSSIAYWLKKKAREGLNVVVVEKDSTVSFYNFNKFFILFFLIFSTVKPLLLCRSVVYASSFP